MSGLSDARGLCSIFTAMRETGACCRTTKSNVAQQRNAGQRGGSKLWHVTNVQSAGAHAADPVRQFNYSFP